MTQKEIAELRRHFKPDRVAIRRLYGCYVNTNREIVSYIDESLGLMPQAERDTYLALLKKSLSGNLGRNLLDIVFSTEQVRGSDEHALLMRLRETKLEEPAVRDELFRRIITSTDMGDTNYVILLAFDAYDVPKKGKDGGDSDSEEVFSYILCAVCPTKELKTELQFYPGDNEFHATQPGHVIAATELGFLFPAFDNRAANIYNALFFTRSAADTHADFVSGVFNVEEAPSADEQREAFERVLTESLGDECGFTVVQTINERLAAEISAHKEAKIPEPLAIGAAEISEILTDCGVSAEAVKSFEERAKEELGEGTPIRPENVIDSKKLTIKANELTVTVTPEESFRLETRLIDGKKCLVIPVGTTVEINGMETRV